jgi:hypothetical protein
MTVGKFPPPFQLDLQSVDDRLRQLRQTKNSKPYERQKSSLHRELLGFLASLPTPKTLASACADDILRFLIWKDKSGRTRVHHLSCLHVGEKHPGCNCPKRLAAGTVDSLIGKLRSSFATAGLGGEWDDRLGIGNPVSHPAIRDYLKLIKEEQARLRVLLKKAVPIFLDKLQTLAKHMLGLLQQQGLGAISLYVVSRDLCFFTLVFFSGDRASDLGRALAREALFFPDKSGILFNHTFGKTLRGNAVNTFAVRRCPTPEVCPVRNFERYIAICKLIGIRLNDGYLFRSVRGSTVLNQPFVGSAVHNRLKKHLSDAGVDEGETPHSCRSSCSITLALLGVPKESIAKHVGWSNSGMVSHYCDLRETLRSDAPAAVLSASTTGTTTNDVRAAYHSLCDISSFVPVFQE